MEGGYVVKEKDGRRNRYQIQAQCPAAGTRHPRTNNQRGAGRAARHQQPPTTTSKRVGEAHDHTKAAPRFTPALEAWTAG